MMAFSDLAEAIKTARATADTWDRPRPRVRAGHVDWAAADRVAAARRLLAVLRERELRTIPAGRYGAIPDSTVDVLRSIRDACHMAMWGKRDDMIVRDRMPFNAEPPPSVLITTKSRASTRSTRATTARSQTSPQSTGGCG